MTAEASRLEELVGAVLDPELRVITIGELGVLRSVDVGAQGHVRVVITPTYSGCPAMDAIREDIVGALAEAGHPDAEIVTTLSPPWSTDMITESGRTALALAGIAPPHQAPRGSTVLLQIAPHCPRCGSGHTEQISRFGSTACQSIWRCTSCAEPFDAIRPF
ncbi:ring-1,2-phenylacetyl-CoA epoxidase subunit PaaD [Allocatelliglobosispora scoriae]|uniref:Ring-1,2-phenylacetyl-CoA epoxidase subunit PaaD n=1 Tax=Allocatelliglobosispora scoriae TaxID=643052 RepID=A0A841BVF7_9ACTN|nr:ring-1,2-phenylacetyl-CoA epoxidase subunit PaaD [Allocatelliglobosispora scoriae]